MFDLDAFCTSLTAPKYGGFPPLLATQIRAWAASGKREDRAKISKPHQGWMHLDPSSQELISTADDIVVRRILAVFLSLEMEHSITEWMHKRNGMGKDSGLFASLAADWEAMGMGRDEILAAIDRRFDINLLVDDTEPTCIGTWLLTVPDADLPKAGASWQTALLFARHAPKRALAVVRKAFQDQKDDEWRARLAAELIGIDPKRWLDESLALLKQLNVASAKLWLLQAAVPHRSDLQAQAEEAAIAAAADTDHVWCVGAQNQGSVFASAWMAQTTGKKADALLSKAWSHPCPLTAEADGRRADAVAASLVGEKPSILGSLRVAAQSTPRTAAVAIAGLATLGAPAKEVADLILAMERRCAAWLEDQQAEALSERVSSWRTVSANETKGARRRYMSAALATAIGKAGAAQVHLVADAIRWMGHEDSPVRRAASRLLANDPKGLPERLKPALTAKSADARLAAVGSLVLAATPECMAALGAALSDERSDDVRDAIMAALAPIWSKQGRKITDAELAAWIKRSEKALAKPVAAWLDEKSLPPLKRKSGKALTAIEIRWLCWRQSRQSEILPDAEARYLLASVDRSAAGDFAQALLSGFLASKQDAKDRWAITLAGLLGDDRLVPLLHKHIDAWVQKSRGKIAEYATQAIALLDSDIALQAVDQVANAYRTKNRNVGSAAAEAFTAAAARRNMSPDELGDAVVPWLGFVPGETRTVAGKKGPIAVSVGVDGKLSFRDGAKTVASLPSGVSKEVKDEIKALSAQLRETMKAQMLRHARMLVQQRRWDAKAWCDLYGKHPALRPFAVRLAWGHYGKDAKLERTFRILDDGSLTDAQDSSLEPPKTGQIGIVHPLEISEEQRAEWRTHLADHEIEPSVPQFDRPVVRVKDAERSMRRIRLAAGTKLNGMTFKGRAERLGWRRGSVVDAGGISSYVKSFPSAGIEVIVGIDGMYMGMGMEDSITINDGWFVRQGSVTMGSYVYDEPSNDNDPRVVPFGEVPPIVFSETMAELGLISGKTPDTEQDDA
jgi:hypothetical protein